MAKTATKVDRDTLELAIAEAEKNGPLVNRQTLYDAAASIYNANKPADCKDITFSIVLLRVQDWKLELLTPVGKKGRRPGSGVPEGFKAPPPGTRVKRKDKFAKSGNAQNGLAALRTMLKENNAQRYLPLVDRIEAGSRGAATRLTCLACVAFNASEVKRCGCVECPLYLFRPTVTEDANGNSEIEIEQLEEAAA